MHFGNTLARENTGTVYTSMGLYNYIIKMWLLSTYILYVRIAYNYSSVKYTASYGTLLW